MSDYASDDWQFAKRQHAQPTEAMKTMADLLFLPETERKLMNWLLRQQSATLAEIMAHATSEFGNVQAILDGLTEQGFLLQVEENDTIRYQPRLKTRKGRQVPNQIWDSLEQ